MSEIEEPKISGTIEPVSHNDPIYVGGIPIVTDKQMRPRDPEDWYETDLDTVRAYIENTKIIQPKEMKILDPGAGTGVFGKIIAEYLKSDDYEMHGVEKQSRFEPSEGYDEWFIGNFLKFKAPVKYDLIIGNPPYKIAEKFFWHARECLSDNGTIIFLLRLGFLASESRYKSMWTNGACPTSVTVLNTRPSFTGDGKTYPADFAFFKWEYKNGKCVETANLEFLIYERRSNRKHSKKSL